ncbi:MAG: GNAT family N-acetyltransferase [Alphaproteobacteria bacterium]|jgi:RimJ/RimL family protein N-acetyltransferase|nr:GNAT family N-acetyltransferase [Alphaproteobacteria bacterium]
MTGHLETERLFLRPFKSDDLTDLAAFYGDREVMAIRKLGVLTKEQSAGQLAIIQAHWQQHGYGLWRLSGRESGVFLGESGLRHPDPEGNVELSYGLTPNAWGQGLATEASLAVLSHGFVTAGLDEVVAIAQGGNLASRQVLVKLGMTLAETWQNNGTELVRYSIWAKEFNENAARRTSQK